MSVSNVCTKTLPLIMAVCIQDIADVASTQVRTMEVQQVSREKENRSLRQQLLDFQVQSDEKTIIGEIQH